MMIFPGIGPVEETGAVRPPGGVNTRPKGVAKTADIPKDAVTFSVAARVTATVAGRGEEDSTAAAMRAERIAQARKNIEQGVYRMQDVVEEVALRLASYMG